MIGWNFYRQFQDTQGRNDWYQARLGKKQLEKPPEPKLEDKVKKYDSEQ